MGQLKAVKIKTNKMDWGSFEETPLEGALVGVSTDANGIDMIWKGITDANGVAFDEGGLLPLLAPGDYYIWRHCSGYTCDNPMIETVMEGNSA